ncbi:MAG: outer membrane lipoprotein carrier protein LolA [Bacteroidales bacterium]|nr:outer membrane lipoprotein carrier protein LolA [Bacteroidales bacterium]
MKTKRTWLPVALLIIAYAGYAQVDDSKSKDILNNAGAKFENHDDVRIEFTYNMTNDEYDIHEEYSGKAWMKKEKYKIDLKKQIIMSDGETIWTYLPGSKEVQVASADENDENNPLKILTNWEENYRSKYIRTEIVSGHTIDIIDLVPQEGKSFYKVRVRIDQNSKQLISSSIYDKNGTTYTYIIEEFKTNSGLPDSTFRFNKSEHPGVEVIDLR